MSALNDLLVSYLEAQHIPGVFAAADLATLIQYDLSQRAGGYTLRFQQMLSAAAAFVPAFKDDDASEEGLP